MSDRLEEERLLRHFAARGRDLPPEVVLPPGDDLGMIGGLRHETAEGSGLLLGADQVVIGRHVRPDEDPFRIGRKAMLRNLSDVAAMAGRPIASIATATIDPGRSDDWTRRLHAGLHETGLAWGAPLVGGDLATHAAVDGPTVISVTIVAAPGLPDGRVITRRGGRPGDLLAITGRVGGSLAPDGGGRHLDFVPRLAEATGLARELGEDLVAMIDLSDGLARDAARIAEAAGVAAMLDADALPLTEGCDWKAGVADGEDYELLAVCRRPPPACIGDVPITVVGRLVEAGGEASGATWIEGGAFDRPMRIDRLGWEHLGGDGR